MSLIDPSTRWWNRSGPRRTGAWICWGAGAVASLAGGWWAHAAFDDSASAMLVAIAMVASLLLLLGGMFLHFLSNDDEDVDPRVVGHPIAVLFLAQGVGGIAHALSDGDDPSVEAICFAAAGLVAILLIELLARRVFRNRAIRSRVERSGVKTTGQVTRARGYWMDYSAVTRVTVSFVDREGRTHWVSQTIGGKRRVGDRVTVTYSPDDLHRKAGVIIQPG